MSQQELAKKIHVDRTTVGKYENGKRRIPKDIRPELAKALDDPVVYFAAEEEATGGVTLPYLDGDKIDHSPAAMKELVQWEVNEALEKLKDAHLYKPAGCWSEDEKGNMRTVLYELLDAATSLENLVAVACENYGFSTKKIYLGWRATVKQRGWMK